MTTTPQDLAFLCRMMGAPFPAPLPVDQLPSWYRAAAANPTKNEVGQGRISMLLANLPTEEDAARTLAEGVPVRAPLRQDPDGVCSCESGRVFRDCHGADSMATDHGNAQDRTL